MTKDKKQFKVVTIGGATQDIFMHSDEGVLIDNRQDVLRQKLVGFEYGAKINISKAEFEFGGGASNAGVCLSRLGADVSSVLCVGKDKIGEAIIDNMKKNNVGTNLVCTGNKPSGTSCVVVYGKKTHDHILFTYRGANEELVVDPKKIDGCRADWFYISSLSGRSWPGVLNKVFATAKKEKIDIAWNPGNLQIASGKSGLKSYLEKTKVLIVNKDEAMELLGKENGINVMAENPRKLAKELLELGPDIVVLTNGEKGSFVANTKNIYFQPVFRVKKEDTTGVGDAFGSTFIWGLYFFQDDIKAALEVATINAAAVISKKGAQRGLLTKSGLLKRI